MNTDFEVGQLYMTTTSRTVEIVAVDQVESEEEGDFELNRIWVIAYRAVGANIVHLRSAANTDGWQKVSIT